MTSLRDEPSVGLRERKKARTREAIQAHAIRLFTEQGYPETTVEQIADAAEVSPSTFFRYFPTKEDVVLYDRLDQVLIESFLRQPAGLTPLQATRAAMRDAYEHLSTEESEREQSRQQLIFTVPEFRSRMIEQFVETMSVLAEAVAKRTELDRDDPRVLVFSGATFGAILSGVYGRSDSNATVPQGLLSDDMMERIDECLALLENGLPL